MHVTFAKAEPMQRPEGLGSCFECLGFCDATVGTTVGVAEANGGCCAVDEELAAVGGAVVGAAESEEVFGVVGAAFGAEVEMVEVDEGGVAAARDAAAMVVAGEDGAAECRWSGLFGASRDGDVGENIGAHVGVVLLVVRGSLRASRYARGSGPRGMNRGVGWSLLELDLGAHVGASVRDHFGSGCARVVGGGRRVMLRVEVRARVGVLAHVEVRAPVGVLVRVEVRAHVGVTGRVG
jgi:hypothetical protein